jgi:adenylosuccinate synthase
MPVTIVVGGQFGSEGKGKVAHYFAYHDGCCVAARVGGPNSGHTVVDEKGQVIILRQLPTAALLSDVVCVLPAGSYIDPEILFSEIKATNLPEDRLIIDPQATVITPQEKAEEQELGLRDRIGSTQTGTGAAVVKRIRRQGSSILAKQEKRLSPYLHSATDFLRSTLNNGKRIIIEGTQGFGLSLLHSEYYPFCTGRDTSAAGFLAETGLSPFDVDDIILVLRAFPIRVPGNSGALPKEIRWQTVSLESGNDPLAISELTSVTRRTRRVARFDPKVVKQAMAVNRPTRIVMNHLDYVDRRCSETNSLTLKAYSFVMDIEASIGQEIDCFGFGPSSMVFRAEALPSVRRNEHAAAASR